MPERILLDVDGQATVLDVDPAMPLLYALRDDMQLNNPRFGCGLGQCGACTVHLDGVATRSCSVSVAAAVGTRITTLAGLGTPAAPHKLQTAFMHEQASQCGYCLNGWMMTAAALLHDNPNASEDDIRAGLAGVKCRCGAHMSIIRAVIRAAQA